MKQWLTQESVKFSRTAGFIDVGTSDRVGVRIGSRSDENTHLSLCPELLDHGISHTCAMQELRR